MPARALDRKRLRHLLTMALIALDGPDDGSIVEAIRALIAATRAPKRDRAP